MHMHTFCSCFYIWRLPLPLVLRMQARSGIRARAESPQQRSNRADGSSIHLSKLSDATLPFSSSTIGSDSISVSNSSTIAAKSPVCRTLDLVDGPGAAPPASKLNRSDSDPVYVGAYRDLSAGDGSEVFEPLTAATNLNVMGSEVAAVPSPSTPAASTSGHMRSLDITGILGTPCTDRDRSALIDELPCRDWHDATPAEQQQRVSLAAASNVPRPGPRGAWAERAREPLVLKSELDKGGVRCDVSNLFNNSD